MTENPDKDALTLICTIVNFGCGSKVLKYGKQNGINGGTIFLGKGTSGGILDLLGMSDARKEIVLMLTRWETAEKAMEEINKKMKLSKPNHGIAFLTNVKLAIGANGCKGYEKTEEDRSENMYQAITIVVEKGKAEQVIEAAQAAGARGGTIINARGSGVHETSKVFNMEIEPEKEIVLILSEETMAEKIVKSIDEEMKIEEPGHGIIYVQNVEKAYGLC